MKTQAALLALSCLAVSSAWAINKCTGADGSVVFQDAPCSGKGEQLYVRPSSGVARTAPASEDGTKPQTNAERIEGQIAASQKERRLRELSQREVPGAEAAIQQHLANCEAEQARIQRDQFAYVQNLYGKTHAAQKAAEMAAVASRCDTRDRELRSVAERLKNECQQLGGCT
jgi:hypothetical protein